MIIIVEGIDRIGKTTLCNKLSSKLNIPIHKYNGIIPYYKMKNDEETDKMLGLIQLLKETNSNIIFDRFHFTDFVYGIIERKYESQKADFNFELIEFELLNLNIVNDVHLILMQPTDVMLSSYQHRKDLTSYNDLFEWKFMDSKIKNKYKIDYNQIDDLVKKFEEDFEKFEEWE